MRGAFLFTRRVLDCSKDLKDASAESWWRSHDDEGEARIGQLLANATVNRTIGGSDPRPHARCAVVRLAQIAGQCSAVNVLPLAALPVFFCCRSTAHRGEDTTISVLGIDKPGRPG